MGESLVLQVSGIPTSLFYKMVRDKLLIHFLRRSNGGDGEVDVCYPTEEEGVAILTFGHEEVAYGVLSRRHHLKIEGTTYPLEVIRPQCRGTQVSKPLMALSLDDTPAGEDGGSGGNGRPVYSSVGSNQRRPMNTSSDDSTSIKKHPKSNIAANLNFHPSPLKKIPADEDRRPDRNSPLTSNEKTADSSGLAHHTFANTRFRDLSESRQPKDTFAADSRSGQSKPKGTIADGFTSNPKYPIGDGSDFNPGQPKNTSTDELNSNPKHSKRAIGDSTRFNSGQTKNTSTDELNLNPKLPKNGLGDNTNFKPGNPQTSSPDEFLLNPRNPVDLTESSNRSSLMAARCSSSSSSTSLTGTNPKNHLEESLLSTELFVDPATHTHISVFMKDKIGDILGRSGVEMKTETGEGYNRVILIAKSPHLSQDFYKAAREISDIFMKCQRCFRVQSIDLSNISANATKKLQSYLCHFGIWSSANEKRLQMIGPSKDIKGFMEEWTSAGGDFARFVHLLQGVSPASSRPPVVGMDTVHQSTTHNHNVTHDVHSQRSRSRHRSEETGARGGRRGPDTNSRSKTPSNQPWK